MYEVLFWNIWDKFTISNNKKFTMDLFAALVDGDGDCRIGSEMRGDETAADHRTTPKSGDGRHQVQLGIAWAQLRHLEVANLVLGDET